MPCILDSQPRRLALLAALLLASPAAAQQVAVGGVVYSQYSYQLSDTAAHGNDFDVTRAYLNVIGKFAHGVGTRVTADVYRNAEGSLGYRLKYAYATWTPHGSPVTVKLGQIHTPWLDWEEALWDYRMQGPMPLDRAGYITSADIGIGVDGSWGQEAVNAQAVVVNGEGYSHAPGDRRKDVEARASVRLLGTDDVSRVGGLRLSGYGQLGARDGGGDRNRVAGLLSYRSKMLLLAGEIARATDGGPSSTAPNQDADIYSAYAWLRFPGAPVAMIARADHIDPDTRVAGDARTVLIAGVSYQLGPNVRLLADLDHGFFQSEILEPAVEAVRSRALFQAQFVF